MKKTAFILIVTLLTLSLWAQQPFKLQVGGTGYATWVNPDYLEQTVFDFNDGQIPEGWTLYSEGNVAEPWRFESPATNQQLNFPPDGSTYLYAQSNQLSSMDYMEEFFHSPAIDLRGYKRAFVMFDYDYFENWTDTEGMCQMRSDGVSWSWSSLFQPWNAQSGRFLGEITGMISHHFEMRFCFKSCYVNDHFAIDNVCIMGESEEPVSNNILGFRLWLDDVLIGDVTENEYQIDTDTLQDGHDYTLSVASILTDGVSETTAFTFTYSSCSHFDGVEEFHGEFIDSTRVKLTWYTPYDFKGKGDRNPSCFWQIPDVVTHPGAGYNNGWDVSALHDGLTAFGYNADKEAGFKVMDKFNFDWTFGDGGCYGFRFYVYEGATPFSTITGAYLTLYDGDPLNGGQIIAGGPDYQCLYLNYQGFDWAHIYRTSEDDFSDVSRPIYYAKAMFHNQVLLEEGTYWFVVSFTGSLRDNVHVIPVNRLGETTTGEARIYSEATGWQPMLDPGTQTQQGIAFDIITHMGATCSVSYSDIFRDGELIAHGVRDYSFIDENAPHGTHTYSIQNVYENNLCVDYLAKSCPQSIEVRPCYPPKNIEISAEPMNEMEDLYRLTWNKEDDIPLCDDVKTNYEIYRKHISEQQFTLVGTLAKDDALESFEYLDTVPQGTYYYKVNDYNVFPTGSCESVFAGQYGDCQIIGNITAEAQWSQGIDGIKVEWGEDLVKECYHFDIGDYINAVGISDNFWWGMKLTNPNQVYVGAFVKDIAFYCVANGSYDFMIYTGGAYTPHTLVWQKTVQVEGANQWHTVVLDEPYRIVSLPLWIFIHQQGITNPAAVASDDGSSNEGRWWSKNGYSFNNSETLGGSFMIRANVDNCLDGADLLQMQEPAIGGQHYNLYRSSDNGNYEKIAQFPFPGYWCHVNWVDPIEETGDSCYDYKVTLTGTYEDGVLCESTPAPNRDNPLIDWVEVCDTWHIEETLAEETILCPNPTTGSLSIAMEDFSHAEVYDLTGRLLKQSKQTTLDLGRLPQGLYIIKVFDNSGNSIINKAIKH